MTSFAGRRLFVVDAAATGMSGPRYSGDVPLRSNARALAHWLWGDLRAEWCELLADDLAAARPLTRYAPHSQEWVAAILCAAAVDAGRDRRPGTWARTVAGIAEVTGVERMAALARWRELVEIGLARPRVLPPYWRTA